MEKAALISVYDKTGVVDFASFLNERGFKIISTGATGKLLKESGLDVIKIEEYTGFKEMLDGRVKTLHPKVHGGILFKRDNKGHVEAVDSLGIYSIDVVIVNLYPFEQTALSTEDEEKLIENIDIGGPALIRAAAKNFKDVLVVCDPNDYKWVIENFDSIDIQKRKEFAMKAFAKTSYYDSLIVEKLSDNEALPEKGIALKLKKPLRYGENPHQRAFFYISPLKKGLSHLEQLNGKELSYNNLLDIDVAYRMMLDFDKVTCAIIKHNTPCGVAQADDSVGAYLKALECDPISAFGGIIGINGVVDRELAKLITCRFFEVIVAFDYEEEAIDVLKTKKNLRVIRAPKTDLKFWEIRSVTGGYLLQESDSKNDINLNVVTNVQPTKKQLSDLLFAFKVAKYAKSNAIVYAKDKSTLAIGAGQTSRIDSAEFAAERAKNLGINLDGCVMASDGFFPFRDSVDLAAEIGVKAIIQPGGSIRDKEVIDAANEHGIAMVFTGVRHFRH